jgi:hypothetical protein
VEIKFIIPNWETIPTKLHLECDGITVLYEKVSPGIWQYRIYSDLNLEKADEIAKEMTKRICDESYDHGAQYHLVSLELVEEPDSERYPYVYEAKLRWKDSY